jgi:hypothetical protein
MKSLTSQLLLMKQLVSLPTHESLRYSYWNSLFGTHTKSRLHTETELEGLSSLVSRCAFDTHAWINEIYASNNLFGANTESCATLKLRWRAFNSLSWLNVSSFWLCILLLSVVDDVMPASPSNSRGNVRVGLPQGHGRRL